MYAINNVEYGRHVQRKRPPIISYKKQTPERICSLEQNYFSRVFPLPAPWSKRKEPGSLFSRSKVAGRGEPLRTRLVFTQEGSQCGLSPLAFLITLPFFESPYPDPGKCSHHNKNAPPITTKSLSIMVKNKAQEVNITSYNDKTTAHNDGGTHTKTKALHIVTKVPHIITKAPHIITKALQIMTNVPHNNRGIAHSKKSRAYNIKGTAYNSKCTACNVKCTAYNERG